MKDVAFEVNDLEEIITRARKQGAIVVKDVTEDCDTDGVVKFAILKTVSR